MTGIQKKLVDIMTASIGDQTEYKVCSIEDRTCTIKLLLLTLYKGRSLLFRDYSQGLVTIKLQNLFKKYVISKQ